MDIRMHRVSLSHTRGFPNLNNLVAILENISVTEAH